MIPTHGFLPMIVYLCCTEILFFVLSLRAQDGIEHTALSIFWVLNSMLTPIWSSWALPFWNINHTADEFLPSAEPFYWASRPSALGLSELWTSLGPALAELSSWTGFPGSEALSSFSSFINCYQCTQPCYQLGDKRKHTDWCGGLATLGYRYPNTSWETGFSGYPGKATQKEAFLLKEEL